jgi:hypothetical protein
VVALRISKPGVDWGPVREDTEAMVRGLVGPGVTDRRPDQGGD